MKFTRKLNFKELVWFLILSGFTILLFHFIQSRKIFTLIHPRLHKYILFSCFTLLILSVNQCKNLFKESSSRIQKSSLLFFIPLLFMVFNGHSQPVAMASDNRSILALETYSSVNTKDSETSVSTSSKVSNTPQEDISETPAILEAAPEPEIISEPEIVLDPVIAPEPLPNSSAMRLSSDDFITKCEDLFTDYNAYKGQTITYKGMVFEREELTNNRFIVGRLLMYCCAADAQRIGIVCQTDGSQQFHDEEWVELTGTLGTFLYENPEQQETIEMPLIEIKSIEKIEPLTNPYVYFNN